jgi:hypothetical protein
MDIREQAIGRLVEMIQAYGAEAEQIRQEQKRILASKGPLGSFDIDAAVTTRDVFAAVAYRCEQLIEEITGALLFDRLDAEDEALRVATEHSRNDITEAPEVGMLDTGKEWQLAEREHGQWLTDAPREHFDAAEAADVARINHEMDIDAGAECDSETCVYCGGAL